MLLNYIFEIAFIATAFIGILGIITILTEDRFLNRLPGYLFLALAALLVVFLFKYFYL